jgi:hypothetical protein
LSNEVEVRRELPALVAELLWTVVESPPSVSSDVSLSRRWPPCESRPPKEGRLVSSASSPSSAVSESDAAEARERAEWKLELAVSRVELRLPARSGSSSPELASRKVG